MNDCLSAGWHWRGTSGRIVFWSGKILFRYLITINWKSDSWAVLKHACPCSLGLAGIYWAASCKKKKKKNAFEIFLTPNLWTLMNFRRSAVLFVDRYSYGETVREMERERYRDRERERETERQREGEGQRRKDRKCKENERQTGCA